MLRRLLCVFLTILLSVMLHACSSTEPERRPAPAPAPAASDSRHPYGNPVVGALPWESQTEFIERQVALGAVNRLAGFETKLPDPLPGEEENVRLAARLLAGRTVEPGQTFSLVQIIGPFNRTRGYQKGPVYVGSEVRTGTGGGVCKIATTLYNVVILSNLPIVERRNHGMLVPYVPAGQDATINSEHPDLRFRNDRKGPLLIWSSTVGTTLYIAIYGAEKAPIVSWGHQVSDVKVFPTVYRTNAALPSGSERTIVPGAEGMTVKSWVDIVYADSRREKRELGTDQYRPMPRVIERAK